MTNSVQALQSSPMHCNGADSASKHKGIRTAAYVIHMLHLHTKQRKEPLLYNNGFFNASKDDVGKTQFCPELRCDVSVECGVASISLSMFQ